MLALLSQGKNTEDNNDEEVRQIKSFNKRFKMNS